MASTSSATSNLETDIKVGDRVVTSKAQHGVVRFIGPLHSKGDAIFAGIELDEPRGKHNGVFDGQQYFKCAELSGIFVPFDTIKKSTVAAPKYPVVPPMVHHTKASELRMEAGQKNADAMSRLSGNSAFTTRTSVSRFNPASKSRAPLPASSNSYVEQLTTKVRQLTAENERKTQDFEALQQQYDELNERLLTMPGNDIGEEPIAKSNANQLNATPTSNHRDSLADNLLQVEQQRDELHTKLAAVTKELDAMKAEKYAQPLMADLLLPADYSSEVKSLQDQLKQEAHLKVAAEEANKALESRVFELEEKLISEASDVTTQLEAALQKIADLETANAKLTADITTSQATLQESLDKERKEHEVDIVRRQQAIDELKNTLDAKTKEVESLKQAQASAAENGVSEETVNTLRQQLSEKEAATAALEADVADKAAKLDQLQTDLGKIDQSFKNCEFELEEAKCEVVSLKAEVESLRGNGSAESEKHHATIVQLNESIKELRNKLSEADKNVKDGALLREEEAKKTADLQQKLDELAQATSAKSKEIEDLTAQLQKLNESTATSQADVASQIASTTAEVNTLRAECDDLKKNLSEAEKNVENETRLREEEAKKAADLQQKLEELSQATSAKSTEVEDLTAKLQKLDVSSATRDADFQNQIASVTAEANTLRAEADDLKKKLDDAEKNVENETRLREEEVKKTADLQQKLDELSHVTTVQSKEIEDLTAQLQELNDTLTTREADFESQIAKVTTESNTLRAECDDLKKKLDGAAEAERQATAKIAELTKVQSEMANIKKSDDEQRQVLKQAFKSANDRREALAVELEETIKKSAEEKLLSVSELEKVEAEKAEAMRLKLKDATEAAESKTKEVEALSNELQKLKDSSATREADLSSQIASITTELESLRTESSDLKQNLAKASEAEEQAAVTAAELANLQTKVEEMQKSHDEKRQELEKSLEDANARFESVSAQLEELRRTAAEEKSQAEAKALDELTRVKTDKDSVDAECAKLAEKIRDQDEALQNANALVEQRKAEIDKLNADMTQAILDQNSASEDYIKKLVADSRTAEETADRLAVTVKETQSKYEDASTLAETLQKERDTLEAERIRLDEAVKSAEKNHTEELAKLKTEADAAREALETAVKDAESRASTLEKQLSERQEQGATESSEFSAKYDLAQKELADLKLQKDASDSLAEKLATEVASFKEQVDAVSKSRDEAVANYQKLSDEIAEIRKVNEDREAEIARLRAELEALAKKSDEKNADAQTQEQNRLKELEAAKAAAEEKASELAKQLESEKAAREEEIAQLRAKLQTFDTDLTKERRNLPKILEACVKKERSTATQDLNNLKAEQQQVRDQLKAQFEKDVTNLKSKLKSVEDDLAQEKLARHQTELNYQKYKQTQNEAKEVSASGVDTVRNILNATNEEQEKLINGLVKKIAELEKKVEDASLYEGEAMMQRTIIVELNQKIAFLKELAVSGNEDAENNVPATSVEDDLNLSLSKVRDYCDYCEEFTHATSECPKAAS